MLMLEGPAGALVCLETCLWCMPNSAYCEGKTCQFQRLAKRGRLQHLEPFPASAWYAHLKAIHSALSVLSGAVAWAAAVRQLATHDEPATALSAECAAILHYSMPPCTPPLFGEYIHPFNSLRLSHSAHVGMCASSEPGDTYQPTTTFLPLPILFRVACLAWLKMPLILRCPLPRQEK
eukprot:454953-Pelagomonas_calceolata.AAC.2